jgi:hypothetical protein
MLEDLELDIGSEDWTCRPLAEAKRDAQLEKATQAMDDFLEFGTGCAKLSKAHRVAIVGVEAGEELPQPPQPDPWRPVKEFIKTERQRIRQGMTVGQVRSGLAALSDVLGKVARGAL